MRQEMRSSPEREGTFDLPGNEERNRQENDDRQAHDVMDAILKKMPFIDGDQRRAHYISQDAQKHQDGAVAPVPPDNAEFLGAPCPPCFPDLQPEPSLATKTL